MSDSAEFWNDLLYGPDSAQNLDAAMEHVALGLSNITGQPIGHGPPQVRRMTLAQVSVCSGDPETPAVGIYLKIESGLIGWALLSIPLDLALRIAAWVMETPPEAASQLSRLQKSALGEVGNLALSYFLNAIAGQSGVSDVLLPSPQAVIVDMLGALLNLMVMPVATAGDELVVVETAFHDASRSAQICFWIAPDLGNSGSPFDDD